MHAFVCWAECVCGCTVTYLPLSFSSHSLISPAWTSLWHCSLISGSALTGSAPSPVCCCVGFQCLYSEGIKTTEGLKIFDRVCLCALLSDMSSVRADHLPTSRPRPAVTISLYSAAVKYFYKQEKDLNVRPEKHQGLREMLLSWTIFSV